MGFGRDIGWRSLCALWVLAGTLSGAVAGEAGPRYSAPLSRAELGTSGGGRVIVKYRAQASVLRSAQAAQAGTATPLGPRLAATMGQRLGLALRDGRVINSRTQVLHASTLGSAALAARLAADPAVEWAVEDRRQFPASVPNDPLYADKQTGGTTPEAGQWYLRPPSTGVVSAMNVEGAWDVTEGSSSLVVAVLDTGTMLNHPDLASKLLSGYDFVSDVATANDGSGRDSNPSDPGDWITAAENSSGSFKGCGEYDSSWHGTQTAGLVGAATHNGIGMAGVAPNVKVMPVRVMGKCGGYVSDIVAAMRWAAGLAVDGVATNSRPARVINLSLGGSGSCDPAYQDVVSELEAQGVVVVAAAGNEGTAVGQPANCAGVIGVAGVRHTGTKVGYSSLGPQLTVAAPAGNCVNETGACLYPILSTSNTGTRGPQSATYTDGYNYAVGTSFSSPLVAGTVALMLSVNPALTPSEVASLIKGTARQFPSTGAAADVGVCHAPGTTVQDSECYCTTSTCGAGLIDAAAAVQAAQGVLTGPVATIKLASSSMALGDSLTLDGSGSLTHSAATITGWQWSLVDGSDVLSFTSATHTASVSVKGKAVGAATVKLTVTDSLGQQAVAEQTLAVLSTAPVVSLSYTTATPEVGDVVVLDASGSLPATGLTLTGYQWTVLSGASRVRFTSGTQQAAITLEALAEGSVTVQVTVTDSLGQTASLSHTLTVQAASANPEDSSGGGALGPWWALGLLWAAWALRRRRA